MQVEDLQKGVEEVVEVCLRQMGAGPGDVRRLGLVSASGGNVVRALSQYMKNDNITAIKPDGMEWTEIEILNILEDAGVKTMIISCKSFNLIMRYKKFDQTCVKDIKNRGVYGYINGTELVPTEIITDNTIFFIR
tara:strand:+ start:879 stop:1283 length:405 start_codon:yes stop_codon:yes gene_type:complete